MCGQRRRINRFRDTGACQPLRIQRISPTLHGRSCRHCCRQQARGRRRTTDLRAVLDAIFYLLRTGCQWRLIPRHFPAWGTVYHYFRTWKNAGVWGCVQAAIYEQTRAQAGRSECPSVVIMDGQSVKTTERGGVRGFDGYKRVKGRKRHILVDTLRLQSPTESNRPTSLIDMRVNACWPA